MITEQDFIKISVIWLCLTLGFGIVALVQAWLEVSPHFITWMLIACWGSFNILHIYSASYGVIQILKNNGR